MTYNSIHDLVNHIRKYYVQFGGHCTSEVRLFNMLARLACDMAENSSIVSASFSGLLNPAHTYGQRVDTVLTISCKEPANWHECEWICTEQSAESFAAYSA